ncbi:hypothetical protein Ari01nite_89940 [Paractinoplanes rishiriensis]|uniref:Uncharacterized protein n=1 Tax=Paractinoplanes rishiriensis TaxID=1050105 RepID=A0A919MZP8_9ACTN|nr:hypothetical protein Ari01nite_89940 [Actinoplanes rishiriensis]
MGTDKPPTGAEAVVVTTGPTLRKPPPHDPQADDGDIVEIWGRDSFPASDPPANW